MRKIIALIVMLPTAALADASTAVDVHQAFTDILQPILFAVGTAAAGVITAAASYAMLWLRKKLNLSDEEAKKLGLEMDEQRRQALDASLTNAAGLALNQLGNKLQGITVDAGSPAVKMAVDYVIKTAPDALQHFNLQGQTDEIAQKIIAKMPQVANTTTQS